MFWFQFVSLTGRRNSFQKMASEAKNVLLAAKFDLEKDDPKVCGVAG